MIIVKMNSSTLECSIAASELREIGLTPESLVNGEQNSVSFMTQLNEQMSEQLSFDPEQEVMLLSKNMMADGSVRIFAMKMTNEDIQEAAARIRTAADGLNNLVTQERIDDILSKNGLEKGEALSRLFVGVTDMVASIYARNDKDDSTGINVTSKSISDYERYTVEFSRLEDAGRFAKVVRQFPIEDSALYKSGDTYYMVIGLKSGEDNVIYEFRKTGIEYADNLLVNSPEEDHLKESGECIIKEDAVGKLSGVFA